MYIYNSNATKHKTFISFYHKDDQKYKKYIDDYLSSNIINKSVNDGEYDPDNSDQYIKRLIREDKISDSSVVVVLIGPNTKGRKHVDWEIYAGLSPSINGNAGLVGIILPELEPTTDGKYRYDDMPARLSDNWKSGYADMYTWDYAVNHFDEIVEKSFNNRIKKKNLIDNSRIQKKYNT